MFQSITKARVDRGAGERVVVTNYDPFLVIDEKNDQKKIEFGAQDSSSSDSENLNKRN